MFVIRETETGAFCTGQRYRSFSVDMQAAAQFVSRENAEKAINAMFRGERDGQQYNTWTIDDQQYHPDIQAYINQCVKYNNQDYIDVLRDTFVERTPVLEVAEVKLTLV